MRRRELRLGRLERAVEARVREELEAFLEGLENQLDPATFERVLEITARLQPRIRNRPKSDNLTQADS